MKIKASGIVFGLLVAAAGVLLLLFNAGTLPMVYKSIIFSWQMLLMAIGFTFLFSQHKFFPGIILMLLGGFLLLPKLDIEGLAFLQGNGWAVFLIVVGIIIIGQIIFGKHWHQRNFELHRKRCERRARAYRDFVITDINKEAGFIERNYVFGGSKEKIDTQEFKGGDINCVFGGFELDLTDAKLAEGTNILEINTVFGGVTLYIPSHWRVEIRESQVFGRFVDKRPQPTIEVNENRVLIIKASSAFGGGEIRNR